MSTVSEALLEWIGSVGARSTKLQADKPRTSGQLEVNMFLPLDQESLHYSFPKQFKYVNKG